MGGAEAPIFAVRAEALTAEQREVETEVVRRARLAVAHAAVDVEDCRMLLDMLDLGRRPDEPAPERTPTVYAWMKIKARSRAERPRLHLVDADSPRRSKCRAVSRGADLWCPGSEDDKRCVQCSRANIPPSQIRQP